MRYFETRFLEEADRFIAELDKKSAGRVLSYIDLAEQTNDLKFFKKLNDEIWEFRNRYMGPDNTLLAFWDKTGKTKTFLITHRYVKNSQKVPQKEIDRTKQIREEYFSNKKQK